MARQCHLASAVLCAALAAIALRAQGQVQNPPAAQPSAAESGASVDPRATIDELLKQSYDHINVEVQFQKAAEFAQQALDLSEKIGDKKRESTAMVYLAAAYGYGGRTGEALEISKRNVALARETGDQKILEQALNTAGSTTGGLGRYEESLSYFYECLAIARQISDKTMQYMSLLNIGDAYSSSGEPDRAEAPLQESLRLAGELKNGDINATNKSKKATEMALLDLGAMEADRYRYRAALTYYERVHASVPESQLWVIAALEGMAEAHEHLGEPKQAIELLEQAIPLADKASSGDQSARLVSLLGVNQEMIGDSNAALASQNAALSLARLGGGNPDLEWQIESRLGHIDRSLGRIDDALQQYRAAIDGIEHLRAGALYTEEGRAGVLEKSRDTYAEMSDLLYELGRVREALDVSERGRARGFLDMLAATKVDAPGELSPQQKAREDALQTRIVKIEQQLWKDGSSPQKQQHSRDLAAAEEDLDAFQIETRRENPRYANLHYPEPIDVRQIQDGLPDEQTVLLEFQLGEKRSLVWCVAKDRVDAAVLPSRQEIGAQVSAYRRLLTERASALTVHQSLTEIGQRGRALYKLLMQPIAETLRSRRRVIIVPDGVLEYLPFEALVPQVRRESSDPGSFEYLLERFAVVYAPSASSLEEIQATRRNAAPPTKALLAFGDPIVNQQFQPRPPARATGARSASLPPPAEDYADRGFSLTPLPYSRTEAIDIARLFPARERRVYLGAAARVESLKAEKLEDYRYIHFASHAFVDENSPLRSGIIFSPDTDAASNGVLQVRDIMRLKLDADMVTLSACSTGLGKLVTGEGVLGLTRAFFYAGASNLTVSLWNVNDSATASLMTDFYANLKRGLPKASALRQAKLSLLHGNNIAWRHPYYWAPFILVGEGR